MDFSELGKISNNFIYVEFSALGRFNVPMGGGGSSIHLLFGPAVAFKATCEVENIPIFGDIDCGELVKSRDVGVAAGAGVLIPVSEKVALSADIVYTLGLQSIIKESDEDAKNRAANLWLGVAFPLAQ